MARFSITGLLMAALLGGVIAGAASSPAWAQSKVLPESREQVTLSFAPLVKSVDPAVVNIYTRKRVNQRPMFSPLFNDPLFKRFFGEGFGMFGMPRERIQNSLGSGVIVSQDGLIVTNYHVIKGADEITVVLSDRREFPARVVLHEERTDLSVLMIEAGPERLPALTFGDSDAIEVGDLVLAIGNPFGVGRTVTSGIVSALARTNTGISDFSFFIQTDAAINPGNSGGALVTMDGKLVGINTAIFSKSGGSIGIGFAIPSNMVSTVVASARAGGQVMRPWPGFLGQTVTSDLAEGFGLDRPGGVVVTRVFPGGPADRAGLRKGDVITSLENRPIEDISALRYRVATRKVGAETDLGVWRDRNQIALSLPLELAPETPARNQTRLDGRHPLRGAVIANLSPALAEEMELDGAWEGTIIVSLDRNQTAYRLGFRPGDIIVAINRKEVANVAELQAAVRGQRERWAISFSRGGRVRTVEFSA